MTGYLPDYKVLESILLLQSSLQAAPDEERLQGMLARGLIDIPSVSGCLVTIDDNKIGAGIFSENQDGSLSDEIGKTSNSSQESINICINTIHRQYGHISIFTENRDQFEFYKHLVDNTANLVALFIENKRNSTFLADINANLEKQVRERTADLRDKRTSPETYQPDAFSHSQHQQITCCGKGH